LLRQMFHPAQETQIVIDWWIDPEAVWKHVFIWWEREARANAGFGISMWNDNKPKCRLWKCSARCSAIASIMWNAWGSASLSDILKSGNLDSVVAGLDISALVEEIGGDITDPISVIRRLTDGDLASCISRWWKIEVQASASAWVTKKAPMIARITRMLLAITIALSITMILYNSVMYIVQVWQWKEWKSLTKNIAYIIVWILIALFSVIIIRVIESIPTTLSDSDELPTNGYEQDRAAVWQDKWTSVWTSRRDSIFNFN